MATTPQVIPSTTSPTVEAKRATPVVRFCEKNLLRYEGDFCPYCQRNLCDWRDDAQQKLCTNCGNVGICHLRLDNCASLNRSLFTGGHGSFWDR